MLSVAVQLDSRNGAAYSNLGAAVQAMGNSKLEMHTMATGSSSGIRDWTRTLPV